MTLSDSIPPIMLADTAWFFDVDGTLAGIETRPEWVTIPANIKEALCKLSDAANGALALVSGRPIAELDTLSAPLRGPAAGVHGAKRRDARGDLHRVALSAPLAAALAQELKQAITAFDGCHVEEKGVAFALHYRQGPQHQESILALAQDVVTRYPELVLQPGKCVVELKPACVDKGAAIAAFMQEAPFAGRTPLFIGDDLTDEAGFKQVNVLRGITIKVGPGNSVARYHLDDVDQVHQWILTLVEKQKNQSIKTKKSVGEGL
ncbi:Trehalose-6-phosphate phosphatase [Sodalis glossinidius str. 'morsitans']|uniref:Trehalose 6-phosphate phosphatase n=1 Tax=Sodalis glossinidius (strain morsitans) TaxID=343509 RepID=A0A193QJX3_SODGM|nr:trehalose-phosphatase [Sodalis glossinidius]CRL45230.1 Trehalose-6-phosphate phosphatase [Sodalis glossinidius str. 'morsitans']